MQPLNAVETPAVDEFDDVTNPRVVIPDTVRSLDRTADPERVVIPETVRSLYRTADPARVVTPETTLRPSNVTPAPNVVPLPIWL